MATRVMIEIQSLEQFWLSFTQETCLPSFIKIGPVVYEEKMFKEIVDDARRTPGIGRSQKLTMSTLCSVELKKTRCVCETLMPPKHPFFEKHDPDV